MKNVLSGINYQRYYKELLPYIQQEKTKKYFFLALTFGSSIFFLLFAISPTLSTIANLKKQITDSKFVEQRLNQKINSLSALSQSYNTISPDLIYATDAIPEKPLVPDLTAQIESIANENSLNITGFQTTPIDLTINKDQPIATLSSAFSFVMIGQGDYASIQGFLNELVKMQRLVSVDGFTIIKDTTFEDKLDINLRGTAFYKK